MKLTRIGNMNSDAQAKVLSFNGMTWRKIFDDDARRKLLSHDEKSALSTAVKLPNKVPEAFQCENFCNCLTASKKTG